MMFKNLSAKNRALLLVLILLAFILFKIILSPIFIRWSELNTEVVVSESRLRRALNLVADKENINMLYKEVSQMVSEDIVAFGDNESIRISVYKSINRITDSSKVKIKSLEPLAETYSKDDKALYFKIKAEASQEELIDFLYHLESPYNLNSIEEIKLIPYKSRRLLVEIKLKRILL